MGFYDVIREYYCKDGGGVGGKVGVKIPFFLLPGSRVVPMRCLVLGPGCTGTRCKQKNTSLD